MPSTTTTFSSADEFSPLKPILPNLSTSEEMSLLMARIAELNRANTVEPSVACSTDLLGQDKNAVEERLLQLQNDQKRLLEKISELEKQQKEQTKATADQSDQFSKILQKISELEKQQKKQNENTTKATADQSDQLSKILEKISEMEKQQKQQHEEMMTKGCHSVFAKHSISWNNDYPHIFYFEISIKKMISAIDFGFAVREQTKLDGLIMKGASIYSSSGSFWCNGSSTAGKPYGAGSTVGIGFSFTNRQIIFTKNGVLLDFFTLLDDSSFSTNALFPFVSLCNYGKIEANFGPKFKFDLTTLC
ncbi:hypothetical protein niasHT_027082 [Heterodera trifolii]|uniref:B30.2/SPRY domain-containing protein n=1 Tax=Heterodera trifolii TaxID=157864 RepID=A0ABD2JGH8_9BILA